MLIGKALHVTPPHSHQAIQIVFGYAGPVRLQSGTGREWTGYPLAIIPSRLPHAMDATRSTYNVVLFVEPETRIGRALTERYLGKGIASVEEPEVAAAMADLFAVWLTHSGREGLIAPARRLLQVLTRDAQPSVVTDERIVRAVAFINANLAGAIALEQVAAAVFLSPGRFRHLFVEQTGMGLRPYVLWRRFLRAWDLLATGESVSTAAHGAGFADSAHFARTSRRTFGFPPSLLQVSGVPAGREEH